MIRWIILVLFVVACAEQTSIVPSVNLQTAEDAVELVSPVSLVVDEANQQIVVVNSNERVFADTGSLALLDVNVSDLSTPQLSVSTMIEAFNFAGQSVMNDSQELFVSFRDDFETDQASDTLAKYSVGDGSLSLLASVAAPKNPFGLAYSEDVVYVVSEDALTLYDADLNLLDSIDLTPAEAIEDSNVEGVYSVAIHSGLDLAVVSNLSGRFLLVNLATQEVEQSVEGPESTRDILIDEDLLYILDGVTESVWVYDLSRRSAPSVVPEELDSSDSLLDVVTLGTNPYGLSLDADRNRLYVANAGEDSVSVVDTQTLTEVARIELDNETLSSDFLRDCDEPVHITTAEFSLTDYVFVACYRSNAVAVFLADDLVPVEIFPNVAEVSTQDNDFDEEE